MGPTANRGCSSGLKGTRTRTRTRTHARTHANMHKRTHTWSARSSRARHFWSTTHRPLSNASDHDKSRSRMPEQWDASADNPASSCVASAAARSCSWPRAQGDGDSDGPRITQRFRRKHATRLRSPARTCRSRICRLARPPQRRRHERPGRAPGSSYATRSE